VLQTGLICRFRTISPVFVCPREGSSRGPRLRGERGRRLGRGRSTIDHGEVANLSDCSGCIATERTRFSVTTGEVVESDIRFDDDVNWTNSPGSQQQQRDVESVAAHEVGHTALLNHVSGSNAAGLTMTSGTPPGTSWRRNLGEGDALGNNLQH
jgi:Matrixin